MTLTGIKLPGQQAQGEKTREENTREDKTTEETLRQKLRNECIFRARVRKIQIETDSGRIGKVQYYKAQARIICNNCVVNDVRVMYLFSWTKGNTGLVN